MTTGNPSRFTQLTPLIERAVRRDGTIRVKLAEPGWGSSGYYSQAMMTEHFPVAFPAGTHMYWNHDTASEEQERPEGDLSRLAAVIVSDPVWESNGMKGPGMYADAKVFGNYAPTIDEIGEHIGVSIRASGVAVRGKEEGREGLIFQSVTPHPLNRVDFVTKPGAGGQIVQIFEAAGRSPSSTGGSPMTKTIREGLANSEIRQIVNDALKARFGDGAAYVYVRDWSVSDGWVVFEVERENEPSGNYRLGMTVGETTVTLSSDAPEKVRVSVQYVPVSVPVDASESVNSADDDPRGGNPVANETTTNGAASAAQMAAQVVDMTEAQRQIAAQGAELRQLREALLLRDARDLVDARLRTAELPQPTVNRLRESLVASVPVTDAGAIDQAAFTTSIDRAIEAARAEIAAILGSGQIRGHGAPAGVSESAGTDAKEAYASFDAALARLGYAANGKG